MSKWQELNDFSMYDAKISCILCKGESEMTLVGEHFKCSKCDHVFNKDSTALPEGVSCYCEICHPRKKTGSLEDRGKDESKLLKKVKKLIKKVTKKKG